MSVATTIIAPFLLSIAYRGVHAAEAVEEEKAQAAQIG